MNLFMDHMESILNEGKIVNINPRWGMSIEFDSVKEMEAAIKKSGYKIPAGGLRDGVDYEPVKSKLTEKYERLTDAIKGEFSDLANQLSPENLACDGMCSAAEANRRKKEILAQWKKLEQRIGMKVTEDMVYGWDDSASKKGMNEEAITPAKAKKIIIDKLNELHLPYDKVTAKTIDFTDLARASMIFVKIHGWKPNPLMGELEKVAKENGFRVDA